MLAYDMQYTPRIMDQFMLCCVLLWLDIDPFTHIIQDYFTDTGWIFCAYEASTGKNIYI